MRKQILNHKKCKMYFQLFDYFLFKTWNSCNWFLLRTNFFILLIWMMTNYCCHCRKNEAFEPYKQKISTKQKHKNRKPKNHKKAFKMHSSLSPMPSQFQFFSSHDLENVSLQNLLHQQLHHQGLNVLQNFHHIESNLGNPFSKENWKSYEI